MECSEPSFESRLSDWLGVQPDRARRIFESSVRWLAAEANGDLWEARVGRYIIFTGGQALDNHGKTQVTQTIFDRLSLLVCVTGDCICLPHNGNVMPASVIQNDLKKLFSPNGVACPSCGADLLDKNPGSVLYSDPPQTRTHCVDCGYHGYRDLEHAFSRKYRVTPDDYFTVPPSKPPRS